MRNAVIACFILACLTTIVFIQVVSFDFVNHDDDAHVYQNATTQQPLSPNSIAAVFQSTLIGHYIPITGLTFLLDYQLYGLSPGGYHLSNLFFHIANVLLLFAFLFTSTRQLWPSLLAAALFAIHPLHVESVAWISARKDLVSTFFFLLALLSYSAYTKRPRMSPYLITMLLFLLGLLSKSILVILPFALLLLDIWPLRRIDSINLHSKETWLTIRKLIVEKTPFFAVAITFSAIAATTAYRSGAMPTTSDLPIAHRIQSACVSYVIYLWKTIWPADLIAHYPYNTEPFPPLTVLGAAAFLIMLTAIAVYMTRSRPYLIVGWLLYLGTLLPVIGLLQAGSQSMADRYTYLALIGIFIALAWAADDIVKRLPRLKHALPAACSIIVLLLAGAAYRQTAYWRDSETLFAHVIEVDPNNVLAQNKMGSALLVTGDLARAVTHIEIALDLNPDDTTALINLGAAHLMQDRYTEALVPLRRALELDPEDEVTQLNLGIALYALGDIDSARVHVREALRLDPSYQRAQQFLQVLETTSPPP